MRHVRLCKYAPTVPHKFQMWSRFCMIVKHLSVRVWFRRSSATSTTTRNCWSFNHLAVRGWFRPQTHKPAWLCGKLGFEFKKTFTAVHKRHPYTPILTQIQPKVNTRISACRVCRRRLRADSAPACAARFWSARGRLCAPVKPCRPPACRQKWNCRRSACRT